MLIRSKLDEFKASGERVSRYRHAVDTLRDLGIDQILLELSIPEPINTQSANAGTAAIGSLYESLGFQKCLHALFSLDEQNFGVKALPVADFGAAAKMNLSEQQVRELSGT